MFKLKIDSLLSDAALSFGFRVAAGFAAYFSFIVLARIFIPSDLGHFVFIQSLLWLTVSLCTFGLGVAANRVIPQSLASSKPELVVGYLRFSKAVVTMLGLLVALLLAGIAFYLVSKSSSPRADLALIACIALPFGALTALNTHTARALHWFLFASAFGVLARPLVLLAALLVVFFYLETPIHPGYVMALLAGIVIVIAVLQQILLSVKIKTLKLPETSDSRHRDWFLLGMSLVLAEMYNNYYIDIHLVVSGLFLKSEELAVYNAVLRTLAILGFLAAAVNVAIAPRAAALFANGDIAALNALARRAVLMTLVPSLLGLVGLLMFGRTILGLFGPQFISGYEALFITASAQIFAAMATAMIPLLTMTGHHRQLFVGMLVIVPFAALVNYFAVPAFGLQGAAIAYALSSLVWVSWVYGLLVRCLNIRLV